MNKICIILTLLLIPMLLQAQEQSDSIESNLRITSDTLPEQEYSTSSDLSFQEKAFYWMTDKKNKDPQTALYLSLALPGAGQVYNRQFFKLPFVYAGVGGILYLIDFNTREYRRYKRAYILRVADREDEFRGLINTADGIKSIRDNYRKNLELSYIGGVAVYGFILLDAFVSAHLSDFDVSDDLSLEVIPLNPSLGGGPGIGIGLRWKL